jgi:hypothetical protein
MERKALQYYYTTATVTLQGYFLFSKNKNYESIFLKLAECQGFDKKRSAKK